MAIPRLASQASGGGDEHLDLGVREGSGGACEPGDRGSRRRAIKNGSAFLHARGRRRGRRRERGGLGLGSITPYPIGQVFEHGLDRDTQNAADLPELGRADPVIAGLDVLEGGLRHPQSPRQLGPAHAPFAPERLDPLPQQDIDVTRPPVRRVGPISCHSALRQSPPKAAGAMAASINTQKIRSPKRP